MMTAAACSDFDAMNINPQAVGDADVKPYWALNKAIIGDQQDPNDAERVFVLYWADIARQDGENSSRAVGRSNDEWAGCLYSLTGNCINKANLCIDLCDRNLEAASDHEKAFYPNLKAFAKIWKVYLMTEFADSFGAMPVDFSEANPKFVSVQDVYAHMFSLLAEAVPAINTSVVPEPAEAQCDPAYKYDAVKWKNFGISMWMRIAMRLSEADPATAKAEFEKAVAAGEGIRTAGGVFGVQEKSGWDDLSGVMSRTWDWQTLSMTMANLTTNLGGASAQDVLTDPGHRFYAKSPDVEAVYGAHIKNAETYLGIRIQGRLTAGGDIVDLFENCTDSPTIGYFFDGIPSYIDPRALAYFCLPGDYDNRKETGYCTFMRLGEKKHLTEHHLSNAKDGDVFVDETKFDATFAYNGLVCGVGYDDNFSNYFAPFAGDPGYNDNGYGLAYPSLAERYRNNSEVRVFFGPWETYFLLAEAAVRGWNAGIGAEEAYNSGIKASLEYLDLGALYEKYIDSERYNRVGTSVKFTHTTEPASYEIDYYDAQAGEMKKTTYSYPEASKTLYGKALNDAMAKILTQKYIANCPWLPLENWSDHRRTGLPFWEMPVSSTEFPFLDGWTKESYKSGQKPGYYAQRINYPAKFNNADPEEYKAAVAIMGMTEEKSVTPLWWARK